MLRVLFMNRSYWPDTEATGQLLTELCEGLVGEFDVEVLAGQPNTPQSGFRSIHCGAEVKNGVRVDRVMHTRFPKSSMIGRSFNLLSFTASAFNAIVFRLRPDVVVTETDPFLLPLLGAVLKWRTGCRFVAYLQDLYPDVAVAVGAVREGMLTRMLRRLLVRACRTADVVVVPGEDMRQRCIRNGIEPARIRVLENWADCDLIHPVGPHNPFREEHDLSDRFVVMYSGNLGMAHLLTPLIEAAAHLRDDARFMLLFVGEGSRKPFLMQRVRELQLKNVRFLPYQRREDLRLSLSAADVHVVSMLPEACGCVMPSKVYGILASGSPLLGLCPADSEVSRLVSEHDVGVVCDSSVTAGLDRRIAEAIRGMADDPERTMRQGQRARQLC
ncbi:MAG: glycosyltransferase family 4 protein, partial [Maioricimonas sp. JB049]